MTLSKAEIGREYRVNEVSSMDTGIEEFLFTLGLYPGETITVISRLDANSIVHVKNARYSMDEDLTSSIIIEDESSGSYQEKVS